MTKQVHEGVDPMSEKHTVLLLGATGRTGRLVLRQLLDHGVSVRAIVRSAERLPESVASEPGLTVVEADLLSLPDEDLLRQVRDCDAVVSCLGHNLSLKGVFGSPRDLVTRAVTRVCGAVQTLRPDEPVKLVLMGSVSVNRPHGLDARRGPFETAALWLLRGVLPPARDNQRAADFLGSKIGPADPRVRWVVVRPDTLADGDVSEYTLHEGLVDSLFAPGETNMANVAHFMCDFVTDATVCDEWTGRLPVIVNAAQPLAT